LQNTGSGTHDIGLAAHYIKAKTFYADSDQRIKKNFRISNALQDLNTLSKLEVTDYKHIDEVVLGSDFKKGLIAQQVLKVFPEAITKTPGEIPNIYAFPESIQFNQGKATFHLSKPHELSIGDAPLLKNSLAKSKPSKKKKMRRPKRGWKNGKPRLMSCKPNQMK